MTHSNILLQNSQMICSPSGLQPYAHCLEHILKEKNALYHLSVCKPSVAPIAPQHHTHKAPLNLDLFLWLHLTGPPPQTLQRSPTECLWCLQAAQRGHPQHKNWQQVGLESRTPGPIPTHGFPPIQLYSLCSAVSSIPIHILHQVSSFYSKNKS